MANNLDIFMKALRESSPELAIVDYVNDYRYRKPTTVKTVDADIYKKLEGMEMSDKSNVHVIKLNDEEFDTLRYIIDHELRIFNDGLHAAIDKDADCDIFTPFIYALVICELKTLRDIVEKSECVKDDK